MMWDGWASPLADRVLTDYVSFREQPGNPDEYYPCAITDRQGRRNGVFVEFDWWDNWGPWGEDDDH